MQIDTRTVVLFRGYEKESRKYWVNYAIVDEQALERSPEPTPYSATEIRRGMRNILIAMAFNSVFTTLTTGAVITSFFTRYLQVDDLWYGLIMAAGPAAVFAQFFGSLDAERTGRIKPKYLRYGLPQRLLWLGMAWLALTHVCLPQAVLLPLLVGLLFITAFFSHFGGGGVLAWFARLVPPSAAGRYFGYRQRTAMVAMLIVSVAAAYLLDRTRWSGQVYMGFFLLAAVAGVLDTLFIQRTPEHPSASADPPPTLLDILATPWRTQAFRWYAPFMFLTGIAVAMMDPFIWRYCLATPGQGGLGISVSLTNLLLAIVPTLVMAWMAPHWGQVIRLIGPKPVLVVATVGSLLTAGVWLVMRTGLLWLIPLQALLGGLAASALAQVDTYMRVEGFPGFRRTTFLASLNVGAGMAGMIGTTVGGVLATYCHGLLAHLPLPGWVSPYHLLFAVALLLRVLVFALLLVRLPLPGDAPGGTVLRTLLQETRVRAER